MERSLALPPQRRGNLVMFAGGFAVAVCDAFGGTLEMRFPGGKVRRIVAWLGLNGRVAGGRRIEHGDERRRQKFIAVALVVLRQGQEIVDETVRLAKLVLDRGRHDEECRELVGRYVLVGSSRVIPGPQRGRSARIGKDGLEVDRDGALLLPGADLAMPGPVLVRGVPVEIDLAGEQIDA